jgi:hypothetical protein
MPNVAELIRDHVTLTVDCVDRIYLNAYVPRLHSSGGVAGFLRRRGHPILSPALFGQVTAAFKAGLRAWAEERGVPWIEFKKGERKDDVVEPHRRRFADASGVVLIGVAQEKARAWRGVKRVRAGAPSFDYEWTTVCVNHYYVYFLDPDWGPGFLKICGYAPYTLKLCLNGHEWAKRQLARRGIAYQALDNGFLTCADPAALQATCGRLGPADVQACLDRWLAAVPLPLGPPDFAAGYGYRLSILQLEVSRTQVFDRPRRGREFCEAVIREHLDLGRPDRVQLLFDRKIVKATPGKFATRVITAGVIPSLHVQYKRCHVKQYFKEGRALRTETTINDARDFGLRRGLPHFDALRRLGQRTNARLLEVEQVAQDCGLSDRDLAELVLPGKTAGGQPAPGLKFGQPRVTALLQALCLFAVLPAGITSRALRPQMVQLLGVTDPEYTPRQMGYDLRRLARKGLIRRVGRRLRYELTPHGRRLALFLTKAHSRIFRPGLQAIDPALPHRAPMALLVALQDVEVLVRLMAHDAQLVARNPRNSDMFVQTSSLQAG